MDAMEDDPWASLRKSRKPEAGQFSYTDAPPPRADATAWQWVKLWLKEDVAGWFRKQLPDASRTLDSTYYVGITRQKKVVRNAVKMAVGKEGEKDISRIPVVLFGRRIGVPGLVLASFSVVVAIGVIRMITGL